MNMKELDTAIAEAQRFIYRTRILKDTMQQQANSKYPSLLPKESGAVRRASMDLTRALAELRKSK